MTDLWDESFDVVIVGSGAGSASAALAARALGKTAVILEKTDKAGGSTALSGGVAWIPNSPTMRRSGHVDTLETASAYMAACAGNVGPAASPARQAAFLREGPRVIGFLESLGMRFRYAKGWADYHEGEHPGGHATGRALIARTFDIRALGAFSDKLRRSPAPPIRVDQMSLLTLNGKTLRSKLVMLGTGLKMTQNRLGRKLVGMGGALQGRLLQLVLQAEIPIWLDTAVSGLVIENGEVVGVRATHEGRTIRIRAKAGVLLNAGGFARNADMRDTYHPKPSSTAWSSANPGDTGEVIRMAMDEGAVVDLMDLAWWSPVSLMPEGRVGIHVMDVAKPHSIVVDSAGERFVNEATSYVAFGIAQYARNAVTPAAPAWAILESRHRLTYRWAGGPPGLPPESWLSSGYIKQADTIEALAEQCGIAPSQLRATVDRFNGFAEQGVDTDFGRGAGAYHRYLGDPTVKPNPSLGALERGPFFAVKILPGDVGTGGGLLTDEYARVLKADGSVIEGLYAAGNCTASVFGRSYPGPGASIGAALVFGSIAVRHAAARALS